MAPATKRKNEEETPETERRDIYTTRGKNKPIVISSTQFERSFKLISKKRKEDKTTKITPRLDLERKPSNYRKAENDATTANSQTIESEAPHVTDEEMEGDWQQSNKTQKPIYDNNLNNTIELTNKYEPLNNQSQEDPENQTQETQPRNTRAAYKPPPITNQKHPIPGCQMGTSQKKTNIPMQELPTTGTRQLKLPPEIQLKCANCGEEGHPASYRGCPYIKNATKLVNQAKKTKLATTNNRIINIQRKVNPGISYAAITSGAGSFKNTHTHPAQTSHTDHGNTHAATTSDNGNEPIQQQKMNTQPPWVDMIKQELLNVVNRLANIEKQLHDDNNRINNLFEILQCQLVAA
ncbi:hypothetical protein PV325_008593 [Microctonus aethiopoides]|nr:hypothetical protein PV325_008593 [Microctonus aethiopoides]